MKRPVAMRLAAAILLVGSMSVPALAAARISYQSKGDTCDGWPKAPIAMAHGFCAGIVVAPPANFAARSLIAPRLLLSLPGGSDWLITDMGHWGSREGKVMRLTAIKGQAPRLTPLLTGLYMPHGIARGPDGKIYVGQTGSIFRFDPDAPDPAATVETVIGALPDERTPNLHPLTFFLFDTNNDLLVEVGAPSDACTKAGKPDGDRLCAESEGGENRAQVRRYRYLGNNIWSGSFTVMARGLRNSLAMVRHASGTLLQADNGIDFPASDSPFEALNILEDGRHYGWPYCYEIDKATPAWAGSGAMDCASDSHAKPALLLPPHAAPLNMLYYDGAMFPELRGQLLMSWHGYKPAGARIAAFKVDAQGVPLTAPSPQYQAYSATAGDDFTLKVYDGPAAEPLILTPGWNDVAGAHPRGAPVGLAVAEDGAIWVAEDRNATILRIACDRP
jgi:glucose/arabinose dehydrogenase